MASSFGGTIKLQGESEYRKALKDITANLKLVSSELKLTNTEFSNGDKSLKQTKTSYENMNKTMSEQKAKVNELRETVKKMEQQYGSNNEKVKTFKTQLNNAENQLKQMESTTDKSNKELKEMKKGFDDAGTGAVKFGDLLKANVLGDAIVGGLKTLGSAVVSVGKSFANIGKQAIEGFADFEQLEGGVKKLFGDEMAETVKRNANDAFKTAGMTANEYMETVTSFSASLINSLSGDTAKATDYADMAIRDMSDNANTFGTDISMLQNAYQGFAKGNYTMLDNLKLGYGGTKTEMERLLRDAEKMPEAMGQKFNLNNYADVVKAINVVQKNMKIAGTTAKEASMTISGSLSATKSAWSNLITGLADDNADLGQLMNNLIESVFGTDGEGGILNNILPRIEVVIDNVVALLPTIINKIVEFMPQLLTTGMSILQKIMDGITILIPQLMPVVVQIINTLVNFIVENLPTILQAGITILIELVKGIAQALPELIPAIIDALILMVETLIDNIDMIIDAGIQLILGLADGLMEALPRLIEKIPVIIEKLIMAIVDNLPKIIEMGITLIVKLGVGLIKAIPQLISKIPQIIKSLVDGFKEHFSNMMEIGKNIVSGIWDGLKSGLTWIKDKIKGWVGDVFKFIKKLFGINSPSKLFKDEIGTNLALGIGEGFGDTMGDVSKEMASAIPTEFDTNVSVNSKSGTNGFNYDMMFGAFKDALKDVKVVMNDREMGTFVTDTIESVVYS